MGLLLIYILCTPVFAAFGRESELAGIFSGRYTQEMQTLETEEAENLQEFYLREGYCRKIETEIAALCKKNGIKLTDAVVHIEGETVSAVLYIEENGMLHESTSRFRYFRQLTYSRFSFLVII